MPEAVAVTISEVRVSPDLRDARAFVAIVGDDETAEAKLRWIRSQAGAIRTMLTVDKERRTFPVFEKLQKAEHVFILCVPSVHRDFFVSQVHTGESLPVIVEETEVYDRLHAHRLELVKPFR